MTKAKYLITSILLSCFIGVNAQNSQKLLPEERNTIDIFKRMSSLVVNVHNLRSVRTSYFERYHMKKGAGSGFIWNNQGYVVTNFHVIRSQ